METTKKQNNHYLCHNISGVRKYLPREIYVSESGEELKILANIGGYVTYKLNHTYEKKLKHAFLYLIKKKGFVFKSSV